MAVRSTLRAGPAQPESRTVKTISAKKTVSAFGPRIACDSAGNAIVAWYQYDENKWKIFTNRYVPGTGWNGVEIIGSDESENSKYPSIAIDTAGKAIVVWSQNNDSIWARRFNGTGWEDAVRVSSDE